MTKFIKDQNFKTNFKVLWVNLLQNWRTLLIKKLAKNTGNLKNAVLNFLKLLKTHLCAVCRCRNATNAPPPKQRAGTEAAKVAAAVAATATAAAAAFAAAGDFSDDVL